MLANSLLFAIHLGSTVLFGQLLSALASVFLFGTGLVRSLAVRRAVLTPPSVIVMVAWFATFMFSALPGVKGYEGLTEALWMLVGFGLFAGVCLWGNRMPSDMSVRRVLYVSSAITCLVAVICMVTGKKIPLFGPPYAGTRLVAGFDGPNELAAHVSMMIGLSLDDALSAETRWRMRGLISTVILGCAEISTWSRGGLIGTGLVVFMILVRRNSARHSRVTQMLLRCGLILCTLLVALWTAANIGAVRFNAGDRWALLGLASATFRASPIIGTGLGGFAEIGAQNSTPHNGLLLFLCAGGALAGIGYLVVLGCVLLVSYNKRSPMLPAIVAFIVQELAFNHLVRGRVSFAFWIIAAIALKPRESAVSEDGTLDCEPEPRPDLARLADA